MHAFDPAVEALFGPPRDCIALDRICSPYRIQLAVVLDRAQRLHEVAARNELEPLRAQRLVLGEGDRVRLEADRTGEPLGQVGVEVPLRLDELDLGDPAARLRVAEVAEELRAVGL